jgi:mercuric ion transport protein
MSTESKTQKNRMITALSGTVLVALCCFTPILVILMGALGLSVFTPYLDLVLLPALIILAVLTFLSFMRWRKSKRMYIK